ncbi:MAG: hypothetical protein WAO35_19840 [Terriglobia bacterium]
MQFLDWLNRYANLLLVVVTTVYVWLTWWSVKALKSASLREREVRHLEDIKRYVVSPLIEWIDSQAVRKLSGQLPLIQVKTVAVQKASAPLGELTYDYPRELDSTLCEPKEISSGLYLHAKGIHFGTELCQFETLLETARHLVSDIVALAKACADRSSSSTSLQRVPVDGRVISAADSDAFVEICFRDILLGFPKPRIVFHSEDAGVLRVQDGISGQVLGKGPEQAVRPWAEASVGRVQDEWARSGLQGRIGAFLNDASKVSRTLELVYLTHALPGDCQYVGG